MPLYQELVDYDEVYHTLGTEPVLINELRNQTETDRTQFIDLIMTRYSGDCISLAPTCQCGATKGRINLKHKCPKCGQFPTSVTEDEINPVVWLEAPDGVDKLMNLAMITMIGKRLTRSSFNFFEWLIDTDYRPTVKTPVGIIQKIQALGLKRGYNNFIRNFDEYIDKMFFEIRDLRKHKRGEDPLYELIQRDRHKVFSRFMPLPNKVMTILEKTTFCRYLDPVMKDVISSFWSLVSIDKDFIPRTEKHKERKTVKAIIRLAKYHVNYARENYCKKPGQIRRHFSGSRVDYGYRSVIVSITGKHDMREVHAPWAVGMTTFRPMLINKLTKRGWSNRAAVGLIMTHIHKFHPLLSELLDEIILDTPGSAGYLLPEEFDRDVNTRGAGFVQVTQRNPSLMQSSAIRTYLTKFKKDPRDRTLAISILICPGQQADFDGDEENNMVALDKLMADRMEALDPLYNLYGLDVPHKVSGNFGFPKPDVATLSEFLEEGITR